MTRSLDHRTRCDADACTLTPAEFFGVQFPELVARHGDLLAQGMATLGARPVTFDIDGALWSIALADGAVRATAGTVADGVNLSLTPAQFSDLVQNRLSLNGMLTLRSLACADEDLFQVSLWDSLLLTLLEGWPTVAEALTFSDRHGSPLDLAQSFGPGADPDDIAHFIREAGYLHLQGWLEQADMAAISAEIDSALGAYGEGDGKSWWATLGDGSRVCVRLQDFVERSPTTARILSGPVWERMIRALEGTDRLARKPVEGRIIEALIKPVGVVAGPSDLTLHRDCHLGRHAYACSRLTVGIAITAANPANGVLRVVAGSHRLVMPVEIAKTRPYLPVIELATEPGDLTVHLSCTLHEATPPVLGERRVMYTEIPQRQPDDGVIDTTVEHVRGRINDLLKP